MLRESAPAHTGVFYREPCIVLSVWQIASTCPEECMTARQRILSAMVLGAATIVGTAASAQKVSTDFDHGANFEAYHTFSFYRVQTSNPLFEQRVRDAVASQLKAKGWQFVPTGGDIAITAIGNVRQTQEYTTFYNDLGPGFGYRGWGGWYGRGWGGPQTATTTSQTIPVGTLVIDLYDTRSHNLVFPGMATDELHTKHTDKNIAIVNKSVDKIFDHFPPKAR